MYDSTINCGAPSCSVAVSCVVIVVGEGELGWAVVEETVCVRLHSTEICGVPCEFCSSRDSAIRSKSLGGVRVEGVTSCKV